MKIHFHVCPVKSPLVGKKRREVLEDIAIMTGGEVCSREKGDNPLEWKIERCGSCRTFEVHKNKIKIIEGDGSDDEIEARVARLRHEIATSISEYDTQKLQERLGRLIGGITAIRVGAFTETEMREKKRRLEDALSATRASMEEGIVPGGGVALLRAGQVLAEHKSLYVSGVRVAKAATEACIRVLCESSGFEPGPVIARLLECENPYMGFDVTSGKMRDFMEAGIVDPLKVTRCAWENAISFARTVLMTEVAVSEQDPEAAMPEAREV